jgi:hypothetical protein
VGGVEDVLLAHAVGTGLGQQGAQARVPVGGTLSPDDRQAHENPACQSRSDLNDDD